MKRTQVTLAFFVMAFAMPLTLLAQSGGSLDPPPGTPAPGMKTLVEIEPRTMITSLPYTISTSGSYYLSQNLSSDADGITITVSNVTVDLNGFTLTGTDGAHTSEGIKAEGASSTPLENIHITGGKIHGFGNNIEFRYVNNSRIENILGTAAGTNGILLNGKCSGNTLNHCQVRQSAWSNFKLDGSQSGICNANTLNHCASDKGSGILLYAAFSGECNGNKINHCTVTASSSYGIHINANTGKCNGNVLSECSISRSASDGIRFETSSSSGSAEGNTLTHCSITQSSRWGIYLTARSKGNNLLHNIIMGADSYGILLSSSEENKLESNQVSGVTGSPSYGIHSDGAKNIIIKNSCMGQITNFQLDANDTYGPIINVSGELDNTNAHPWANFSIQ